MDTTECGFNQELTVRASSLLISISNVILYRVVPLQPTKFQESGMSAKNVFIATLPRSGSTLLGMMLGAHSRICHIGESAYWSKLDINSSRCCCGKIGCEYLIRMSTMLSAHPGKMSAIRDACGMIDLIEEPTKVRHGLSHSAPVTDQDSLRQSIQLCCQGLEIAADAARTVFGKEITIENTKYLPIAEELLRDTRWKVLIIARDPRGIALSNKEAGSRKGVPRPVKDKIDLFLSFARRASEMARHENSLLIRYEDLCRDTTDTLDIICNFLSVRFEPQMMEFKENKGHFLMGNHMMHDQNQNVLEDLRWHEALSPEEKRLFVRDDLIRAYARIGYDLEKEP